MNEMIPSIDLTLVMPEDEVVEDYIINNVNTITNDYYLSMQGSYIAFTGMIVNGKFRFPMMKQSRYDLEFTKDYVLLKLNPDGFFTTAAGLVNLRILDPYYVTSSATYEIVGTEIKLFLKIKKGYTYSEVAEIFKTLTSTAVPAVKRGNVELHTLPDATAYIATVVNKDDQMFIYARKAKRAELKNYASIKDITKSKRPFYFNDHVITGKATNIFINEIASIVFGVEGFQVYGEELNGGYLIATREKCDFCDDELFSEHEHTHMSEVCLSCHDHIEAISALLKMLGDTKNTKLKEKINSFKERLNEVNKKTKLQTE